MPDVRAPPSEVHDIVNGSPHLSDAGKKTRNTKKSNRHDSQPFVFPFSSRGYKKPKKTDGRPLTRFRQEISPNRAGEIICS